MDDTKLARTSSLASMGLLAILLSIRPAEAQAADPAELISRADANGDGAIARSEVIAFRADTFDQLDRNDDGVVNDDDSPPRLLAGRFNEALATLRTNFDADGDQNITEDEMVNGPAPMFELGDTDGDEILSAEEIAALQASMPVR